MPNKQYTFIDLFAGCGGISEGFLQTGRFKSLAHLEWEKPMVDTLRNRLVSKYGLLENEAKQQVIQFDIQKIQKAIEGNWSESSIEKYGQYNASSIIEFGLQDK